MGGLWYNISVKGRGSKPYTDRKSRNAIKPTNEKNFSKTFEKPLDKYQKVWYNIYVIKRENRGSPYDINKKEKKRKVNHYD